MKLRRLTLKFIINGAACDVVVEFPEFSAPITARLAMNGENYTPSGLIREDAR